MNMQKREAHNVFFSIGHHVIYFLDSVLAHSSALYFFWIYVYLLHREYFSGLEKCVHLDLPRSFQIISQT